MSERGKEPGKGQGVPPGSRSLTIDKGLRRKKEKILNFNSLTVLHGCASDRKLGWVLTVEETSGPEGREERPPGSSQARTTPGPRSATWRCFNRAMLVKSIGLDLLCSLVFLTERCAVVACLSALIGKKETSFA